MGSRRTAELDVIRVLDAIYEAAFEPGRWDEVLRAGLRLHGCHAGKVGAIDVTDGRATTLALRGIDPEIHDLWEAEFADQDVWAQAGLDAIARAPDRNTFIGAELISRNDLRRAPVYQEILRRCEIDDLVSAVLTWTDTTIGFLACYGGPSREPFDRHERELHDWIGRHARRAFALGQMLRRERSQNRAVLERLPCAAFVCEDDGRILLGNDRAEALLRESQGLRTRRGRLRAQHPEDQDRLERALYGASFSAVGASLEGGVTLQVRRDVDRAPLSVHVDPVPPDGPSAEMFRESFVRPVALVLVSDPEARTILPEEALCAAFGLTPTESRMLAALCAGETPSEYADRCGVSRETARFHVKQLLAKTGARRQADLVRIALESVVRLAASSRDRAGER